MHPRWPTPSSPRGTRWRSSRPRTHSPTRGRTGCGGCRGARSAPLRHLAVGVAVAGGSPRGSCLRDHDGAARGARGRVARRPLVVKLVADEAYERERRPAGTRARWRSSRAAAAAFVSACCGDRARRRSGARGTSWSPAPTCARSRSAGVSTRARVGRPEPGAATGALPRARVARTALGISGFALGTAGRLTAQKALGDALEALSHVPDGELLSCSETGPSAERSNAATWLGLAGRVRFLGAGRARTSSRCSGPSMPHCSRRPGRTSRTRCSKPWRPGRP